MSERFDVFTFDELQCVSYACGCGTEVVFDLSKNPKVSGNCPGCNTSLASLKDVIDGLRDARTRANVSNLKIKFSVPTPKT